ncbi:MAG: 2-phosphosulfolactate phosphatase, partial [Alphaproteobacteria bacterium]
MQHTIRCEWGMAALRAHGGWADVVIVIDALRFPSLVSLAVSRGAEVVPWPEPVWPSAAAVAAWPAATDGAGRTAVLLRRDGVSSLQMVRTIEPGVRFVQASDNGAPLATQTGNTPTLAGAFRNAVATAAAAMRGCKRILVVPAGERWPDGTLRPALED